jgi:prepilin-type N-terminal cleavage/methylation domain-containing protein
MNQTTKHARGFTLVELLVGAGLLGIILTVATGFLQNNQQAMFGQQARNDSLEDGRAAMSRMGELVNQSAYVYPSGITISGLTGVVGNGTASQITTGSSALALLIPDNQGSTPKRYHGVIYYLTSRAATKFSGDLPTSDANRIGESVLVEAKTGSSGAGALTWNDNTNPAIDLANWSVATSIPEGVLADGLVAANSNLMMNAKYSPIAGIDDTVFNSGLRGTNPAITTSSARILGIGFQINVNVTAPGQTLSTTSGTLLRGLGTGRNIPRR